MTKPRSVGKLAARGGFRPLVGPEWLKKTVWMFRTLADCGWKGVIEFDCHMLRRDARLDARFGGTVAHRAGASSAHRGA